MFRKWFKRKNRTVYEKRFYCIVRNKRIAWSIFNDFPVGLFIVSPDGKMIGNKALWKSVAIDVNDDRDIENYRQVHGDKMHRLLSVIKEQDGIFFDIPVRDKNNAEQCIRSYVIPVRDPENKKVLYHLGYVTDITQRKMIEEILQTNAEKYRVITEELPVGILQSGMEGDILYANQYLLQMLGYSSFNEIRNQNIFSLFIDDSLKTVIGEKIASSPALWSFEFPSHTRQGESLWLKMTGRTILNNQGEEIYFYAIVENLTSRKQAEEACWRTERRFKEFTDMLPETLFEVNAEGIFTYLNKTAMGIFGYSNDDPVPTLWEVIAPESLERLKKNFYKASLTDYATDNEYIGLRKDGSRFPVTVYARPFFEGNQFKGYRGILINISERKKAEEKYRSLIEKSLDGIIIHRNGVLLYANEVAYNMIGYRKGTALNIYTDLIHPDEEEKFISYHLKRLQGKDVPSIYQTIFINKEGKPVPVELNNSVIEWEGEKAVLSVVRDLSQRHRTENELLRLGAAINQIHEAVVITDTNGVIEYVNPAFERLTLYQAGEVIGKKTNLLKSGKHSPEFYQQMWNTIVSGHTWSGTLINKRKDDEFYEEHCVISPIKDNAGKIVNYVAIKRDITEERRMEKQMRQTQKIQAIGTLASGIAHDFNNLLMAMQLFTELVSKTIDKNHPAQEHLARILETQARGKDLINRLLAFSRHTDEDHKEPILIHYAVSEALKIIRSMIPSTVRFVENINDCGYIMGNHTHIQQILMNLITNASHAMEGNGTIIISLDKVDFGNDASVKYACLIVRDTGIGMDKTTRERIFEPFYTTKQPGQGTGLGMTTVHSIVKQYHGEIFFSSEIGKGTVFYIYLPLLSQKSE